MGAGTAYTAVHAATVSDELRGERPGTALLAAAAVDTATPASRVTKHRSPV